MIVDSHCHLDFPGLSDNLSEILSAMQGNGVGAAVCIGVTLEDFPRVQALSEAHAYILATVGVHPENTGVREPSIEELVHLAAHPKVIGIGETGLDYHWHKDAPEWQRERFRIHIRAARQIGKPLIVHNREATADTLRLLKEEKAHEAGGVLHCFVQSWDVAQKAIDLGFYISLSGVVTFKNAHIIQEVARRAPLDRLLVETDSPYLAPTPFRGKRNQPAYVRYIVEEIARLRGIAAGEVESVTTDNFFRLFPLASQYADPCRLSKS